MAASMVLMSTARKGLIKTLKPFYSQVRSGYFVLLPEIPKDTPDTNPVLQTGSIPRLSSLTPENCYNGVGKLVIQYDTGLTKIGDNLQADKDKKKDLDPVIKPLEYLLAQLDHGWSVTKAMYLMQHNEKISQIYQDLHPRILRARAQRFCSLPINHVLKEINESDRSKMTDAQQRLMDKYLLEARLNGVHLSKKDQLHLQTVIHKIAKEKDTFRQKLELATERFKHVVEDYGIVSEFPDVLLRKMAFDSTNPTRGPWFVTLHPYVYEHFMRHCSNRSLRWNTWRAYNSRASAISDTNLNNSTHMEEIRSHRATQAKLLGYSSYAEMSMETKMAGSLENVQAMIASLRVNSWPKMEVELGELQEFAVSRGFDSSLELWDVPYWRRKQLLDMCGFTEEELRRYFPMPHVIKGLFDLCHRLFGVTVRDATAEVDVWDSNVTFYKLYDDNNTHLGSFFLDPYARAGKLLTSAILESGINRCDTVHVKPLAFLVFNFLPPMHGLPSLLTMSDVNAVFMKFGSALQHLMTSSPYSEVAGLTNLEWDVVDVSAHFLAYWLNDVDTLRGLTHDHHSGRELSLEDCDKVVRGRQHLAAYDLMRELYLGALDLELYSRKDFWLDVSRRLWPDYMPFPLEKNDVHPCAFSEIFVGDYQAAYYSSTWSKMIAADIFSAFLEVGLDNKEDVHNLGRRYRDAFLIPGGSCRPNEAFRRFRGRDPCPDALLTATKVS